MITYSSDWVGRKKTHEIQTQHNRSTSYLRLAHFFGRVYLEAVELSIIGDVGDLVRVIKVPVVGVSGGQQGHPTQLMGQSLLQVGDHTTSCQK